MTQLKKYSLESFCTLFKESWRFPHNSNIKQNCIVGLQTTRPDMIRSDIAHAYQKEIFLQFLISPQNVPDMNPSIYPSTQICT